MTRYLVYLEIEGFYSRVLIRQKPELKNQAILIVEKGQVVDVSPEAAELGIKAGDSLKASHRKLTIINYRDIDVQEMLYALGNIYYSLTPEIEFARENQVWLGITVRSDQEVEEFIRYLSSLLVPEFGHWLRFGYSSSKIAARVGADLTKLDNLPYGFMQKVMSRGVMALVKKRGALANVPLEYLWFLDKKKLRELEFKGISRLGQFLELNSFRDKLQVNFPARIVEKRAVLKDVSFFSLRHVIREIAIGLGKELDRGNEGLRVIELRVVYGGKVIRKQRHFSRAQQKLEGALVILLDKVLAEIGIDEVSELVVYGYHFESLKVEQLDLFGQKQERDIGELIAHLNKGLGKERIYLANRIEVSRREKMLNYWDPYRSRVSYEDNLQANRG